MVTPKDFIHRLKSKNHLSVSITDSGSERVKEARNSFFGLGGYLLKSK